MDTWYFDTQLALANLLWFCLVLAATAWPIASAAIEGGALVLLRGALLAATGSLLLLRSDAAIGTATAQLLQGLPAQLTPQIILAIFVIVWIGAWTIVLPRIGASIAQAAGWLPTLAWAGTAVALIYFVVFFLGGIPGALARGLNDKGQQGQAALQAHQQQLAAVREANGTAVCLRLGELQRSGLGRHLVASAARWGLDAQADARTCAAKAQTLTLLQAKTLIAEFDSSGAARRLGALRLTPLVWQPEPALPTQQTSLAQLRLADYFSTALWSPVQHVVRLFADLDLAVTFLLMGELAAALMWVLDVLLRRQQRRSAVGDELAFAD